MSDTKVQQDPRDGSPCAACGTTRVDGRCPGCRQAVQDAIAAIDAQKELPEWEREVIEKHAVDQAAVDATRAALLPWLEVSAVRLVRNGHVVHLSAADHTWTSLTSLIDELAAIVRPGGTS